MTARERRRPTVTESVREVREGDRIAWQSRRWRVTDANGEVRIEAETPRQFSSQFDAHRFSRWAFLRRLNAPESSLKLVERADAEDPDDDSPTPR